MRILLLCFFTSIFVSGFSQESNDLPNRKEFVLVIPVDKGSEYTDSIKQSPYVVHADIIQIYPGESIYVEFEGDKGVIKSIKTVKENLNPKKTISISFRQIVEGHMHQNMMLEISNPAKKDLIYSAKIFLMRSNKWATTDVLPIKAGLSAFETWPDPIVSIALFDWKFASD